MVYRIAQWAAGNAGKVAVQADHDDPTSERADCASSGLHTAISAGAAMNTRPRPVAAAGRLD